jgi:hypothetical protein
MPAFVGRHPPARAVFQCPRRAVNHSVDLDGAPCAGQTGRPNPSSRTSARSRVPSRS